MKRHAFHHESEAEYADAAEYYAGIEPELGGRFCDEIERLIRDVRQNLNSQASCGGRIVLAMIGVYGDLLGTSLDPGAERRERFPSFDGLL